MSNQVLRFVSKRTNKKEELHNKAPLLLHIRIIILILSNLSYELTNMPFSQFHEGYELVDVLQSLRPKLIELYNRTDYDDWSNWVEK